MTSFCAARVLVDSVLMTLATALKVLIFAPTVPRSVAIVAIAVVIFANSVIAVADVVKPAAVKESVPESTFASAELLSVCPIVPSVV